MVQNFTSMGCREKFWLSYLIFKSFYLKQKCLLALLFILLTLFAKAQEVAPANNPTDSLSNQKDLMDVIKKLVHSKGPDTAKKTATVTVLPAIGYNPSIGFLLGINFLKSFSLSTLYKL